MVIELHDICKSYLQGKEQVPVLHHIDLDVAEGEYLAIMGPSGSGKSTLMNIIGLLDQQTSGSYFFDGRDMTQCSDNQLSDIRNQKIGFVFQNFNLLPRQSVLENVALPLLYAGVRKKDRLVRARADEPTGALDTRSGEQIMELFHQLHAEGVTIVMITHEPEIAGHAERVVTIRDGRLENGSFSETEQEGEAS